MPLRLAAFAVLAAPILVVSAVLSGCAPLAGPSDADRAAWSEWFATASDDADGSSVGGMFGTVDASKDDDGIRLDFATASTYRSVELRCIGSDSGTFTLRYRTADAETVLTQEIVCHSGEHLTPIAIPTDVQGLTAFTASATSPDGQGYWLAVLQK